MAGRMRDKGVKSGMGGLLKIVGVENAGSDRSKGFRQSSCSG